MELNLQVNKIVLEYYTKMTQEYDNGDIKPPDVILPPVPDIPEGCTNLPSPHQYLLPSVILWDPLQQLDCFKDGIKCPFEVHGDEEYLLEPRKSRKGEFWWHAGLRSSLTPRQLCSSSWPAVLLSRMYFCTGKINHRNYIAHDPEILSKIPASESHNIPFILLHRTGFTKELSETVLSLVMSGMDLENVEQVIYQQHITNFTHCKAKYEEDAKLCLANAQLQEMSTTFPDYKPIGVPSMEMILASLLDNFQERKIYYNQRMSELSGKVLLMGHFYKASQQMGTTSTNGNGWVPKYDYIYTVMNEHGQVIAWQVTKGTNSEDVSTLIKNVHQRLTNQGVNIDLILTPDCCEQRDWLTSVFGPRVLVKMDPCFAIQKLERRFKIRKGDHDHVQTCVQDFHLVFQRGTDLGCERKEDTPSSGVIAEKLDSFISQWKNVRGESNERLLHDPALRELESLKSCVSNGCLTHIPPHLGAKFVNELRKYLYPVLHRRFLNADLTIPVLTSLFYCWNERHGEAFEGEAIPISSYKATLDAISFIPTGEQFGCVENDLGLDEAQENENCQSPLTQHLTSVHSTMFQILFATDHDCSSNAATPLTESNVHNLDMATFNKVTVQIENYTHVLQTLKSLCPDNFPVNLWHHHLLPCCTSLFSRCDCQLEDKATLDNKMKTNLESFGGRLVNDESDSDGFFIALALGINEMINSLEKENPTELAQLKENLTSVGYIVDECSDDLNDACVAVLRQIICTEWQKNKAKYAKLLTSPLLNLEVEADVFQHKGYYQAEMANILPIAAIQVFKIPLVIFTSMDKFPVLPLVPVDKLVTSKCLYMAHSAAGFGSYYPVTVTLSKKSSDKPKHVCRCGLGNSKNKQERSFCIHVPGRYLTRCECFRNGVACNHLCRCFNCANPQGTSKESRALHACQKTRLRGRHKLQQIRRHPSSLEDSDMKTLWNEQECLAFQFIVDALKFSDNHSSTEGNNPERILEEYQNLQQCSGNTKFMKEKTLDEIKVHLKMFSRNLDTFQALHMKQSEENWGNVQVSSVDVEMSGGNQLVVIVESSE
ncbi:uncharacterized protein LOC116308079 [Actinia tenebrosa]|uniref:Uncharacterized protein LOC116308079 n=1 Tax=Actinia tenebrosa TaxID=6105 RepID=A0A6P8J3W8_ACTTE|nr:uncharacterized protein LOC116308079 [Actinia tenebrosa]